jgi:hypothetical protein
MVSNPGYYEGHGKTPPKIPVPVVAPSAPLTLAGPYTVAKGQTLYFTGAAIGQEGKGQLTDSGLIQVISSTGAIGVQNIDPGGILPFVTTASGVLSVEATGGDAYGYAVNGAGMVIANQGVIQAVSLTGNAYGVAVDYTSQSESFNNLSGGLVAVWAAGAGCGLYYPGTGVMLTNAGAIEVTAAHAVGVDGATFFSNKGSIVANDYTNDGASIGVLIGHTPLNNNGGTFTNSGVIQAGRAFFFEGSGHPPPGTQIVEIDNSGKIIGAINLSQNMGGPDTINNTGTISGAIVCAASSNAVLTNAGTIKLNGGNSQLTTIDNAGTIQGSGTISASGAGAAITVDASGVVDATGKLQLATPKGGVINDGLLKVDGGVLSISGAVTGSGTAEIDKGTLSLGSSFSQDVSFGGPSGELVLTQSQGYGGTIDGFLASGATSLDLRDVGFVGAGEATFSGDAAGGVLTVSDGVHAAKIALFGDYLAATFAAASDSHGGTLVTAVTPPAATLARPTPD